MANNVVVTSWKWGFNQIPKTTPEFAKWAARGVLYGLALINIFLTVFTDIPPHIKDIVGRYSIEIAAFVHAASKMFGLDVDGPAAVTNQDAATITK